MRTAILLISFAALHGAVVIDRIAVIVDKSVIKTSDIDRDVRLTEFLNHQPLDLGAQARREAAERLVDQQLIRRELATGGYTRATDADAAGLLQDIERSRFGAVPARLDHELEIYGLTEDQLRQQLLWQLTVLRFIQQRFEPGVNVTDEEVRAYYETNLAELRRSNPKNNSLAALEPKIRDLLTGEDVNKQFEDWLSRARQRAHIEYRQAAFQ